MLKLVASVAIVECAERAADDAKLRDSLRNLVRPSVGHWWEFVRLIVPLLADSGDPGFVTVRDILLACVNPLNVNAIGLTPPRSPVLSSPLKPSARGYIEQIAELMRQAARSEERCRVDATSADPTVWS
ncbi:MAG: hypothetical protein ACKV2Q_28685 [Planctomycetaceae bacterium]